MTLAESFTDAYLTEFATVVGALLEARPSAPEPTPDLPQDAWSHSSVLGGTARGTLRFYIDDAGAAALTARLMGLDGPAPDAAVIDTLKEVCAQAASAITQAPPFAGITPKFDDVRRTGHDVIGRPSSGHRVTFGDVAVHVAIWTDVEPLAVTVASGAAEAAAPSGGRFDVIMDIELPLLVRFGRTDMVLKTLAALAPGSVVDLGRSPDEAVDVVVGERVIARGEVVIVAGNYGVRILEMVQAKPDARGAEGV